MKYLYAILGGVVVYTIIATIYNSIRKQENAGKNVVMTENGPAPPVSSGLELPNPIGNVIGVLYYVTTKPGFRISD